MVDTNYLRIMTLTALSFLLFSCSELPIKQSSPKAQEGELSLIINISNIKCCSGTLLVAVYNDKSYWLQRTGMIRGRISLISKDEEQIEIHGLPSGQYSVAVHQDSNFNKKLDKYLGLIPREPYGFSNNVGKYGPASFEKASFDLMQDKEIHIKLVDH